MINEIVVICKLLRVNPATPIAVVKGPFRQLEGYKHGSVQQWLKKRSKQPQGENGQTFEVNETRENYDAAVQGYTFFVTNFFLVCITI